MNEFLTDSEKVACCENPLLIKLHNKTIDIVELLDNIKHEINTSKKIAQYEKMVDTFFDYFAIQREYSTFIDCQYSHMISESNSDRAKLLMTCRNTYNLLKGLASDAENEAENVSSD